MTIKKISFLLVSILPILSFSQENNISKWYNNTTVVEIFVNKESGFSNESVHVNQGFGVELSTFNGVYIFKKVCLSLGVGLSFSINEDFKAIPIVADFKWYLNDYGINSPYVLLNTGRNLNIGSFVKGQSSKLGAGYTFESDYSFQYVIEAFIKSKEFLLDSKTNFNYQTTSIGLSLGIKL